MTTSIKGFAAGSAMLAVLALCLAPARAQSLTVPLDVRIPAELTAQITSLTAKVGDTFAFRTTKDEKLGDLDVPAGTLGHGRWPSYRPHTTGRTERWRSRPTASICRTVTRSG